MPHYVLRDFAKADQDWLEDMLSGIEDGIEHLVAGDGGRFQNAVTLRLSRDGDLDAVAADIRAVAGVDHVETRSDGRTLTAFPDGDAMILTSIGDLAGEKSWPLEQLQLESGRLDEVFRTITAPDSAAEAA